MIVINREKAEAITWDRLRVERDEHLAELDLQFMAALERGTSTAEIVEKKQALRDVTDKSLASLGIQQLGALMLDQALAL